MKSSDSINRGIEEFGLVADAQALAARLTGAKSSVEAKAIQGQLLGLISIAGNSGVALSEIMKALSSAGGKIVQLSNEEHDATYQRIMASKFLDADTKNLYDGVARFMTDEEKKYLDDIDPAKEYEVATFDENGNVNGTKKVQGYKLQESFILLKANANKGALSSSQLESLNRKLYDNPNGPQGIADIIKGEGRLQEATDLFRGHLKANETDQAAGLDRTGALSGFMRQVVPVKSPAAGMVIDGAFGSLTETVHAGDLGTAGKDNPQAKTVDAPTESLLASMDIRKQLDKPATKPRSAEELRAAFDAIVDNSDRILRSTDITTAEMVAAKSKSTPLPQPVSTAANVKGADPKTVAATMPATPATTEAVVKPAATGTPLPVAPAPAVVTTDSKTLVAGFKASTAEPKPLPLPAAAPAATPALASPTLTETAQPSRLEVAVARMEESKQEAIVAKQRADEILKKAEDVTSGRAKGDLATLFAELVDVGDKTRYDAGTIALSVRAETGKTVTPAPAAKTSTPLPAAPATMAAPPAASGATDAGSINTAATLPASLPQPTANASTSATGTPLPVVQRGSTPSAAR